MFFKHDWLKLVSELRPHSTVVSSIYQHFLLPSVKDGRTSGHSRSQATGVTWEARGLHCCHAWCLQPRLCTSTRTVPAWLTHSTVPGEAAPPSSPTQGTEQSWALLQGLTEQAAPIPRPHQTWQEASHAGNSYDPVKKDNDPISLWQEWSFSNFLQQELSQLNNSIPLEVALSQCRNLQNALLLPQPYPFTAHSCQHLFKCFTN